MDIEEINNWIDKYITPLRVDAEKIADEGSHPLDWIMQKTWSKTLTYKSHPDEKEHTVYEGLWSVFKIIDELYTAQLKICETYNVKLFQLRDLINSLSNGDGEAQEKLDKIKEILNQ